jgi:hypothetical protein
MEFQTFNPCATVAELEQNDPATWLKHRQELADADLASLRRQNAHWFAEPTGMAKMVGMVWLINQEFTKRGVAPAWRAGPEFVKVKAPPPPAPAQTRPLLLGDTARRNLLRRWVDMEWLRRELGPAHFPRTARWAGAFSTDEATAIQAFLSVNAVTSKGGGKAGPLTPYKTLYQLDVPGLHRLALTGLVDRDAGELARNARKRVQDRYRPRLEALTVRDTYPLSDEEVGRRLLFCEAIELARGSPTDAARVFRWMTGEVVTRQSVHEMKNKIAAQCKLRGRAWTRSGSL